MRRESAQAEEALDHLAACDLCPRYCRVDRRTSVKGALCHTGARAVVHSYGPHQGEEDPLRRTRGSGTLFFAWCNQRCVYCQNWDISQRGDGREVSADEIAGMMLELQAMGCHNINLVSPGHLVAQIIAAVAIARRGILVRHLVLPGNLAGTAESIGFLAWEVSPDTDVNRMDQYHPRYRAGRYPPLDRSLTPDEYKKAMNLARRAGLHRFDRPRRW